MLDPDTQPIHWANRLGFLTRRALADAFAGAGYAVTPEEWAVLLLLWRQDGQSPSALADATIRDRTTMTRLLDGMVAKGLVQRDVAKADRRRIAVGLTGQGAALEGRLVPIAQGVIAKAQAGLGEAEVKQTAATLRRMVENLMTTQKGGSDDQL